MGCSSECGERALENSTTVMLLPYQDQGQDHAPCPHSPHYFRLESRGKAVAVAVGAARCHRPARVKCIYSPSHYGLLGHCRLPPSSTRQTTRSLPHTCCSEDPRDRARQRPLLPIGSVVAVPKQRPSLTQSSANSNCLVAPPILCIHHRSPASSCCQHTAHKLSASCPSTLPCTPPTQPLPSPSPPPSLCSPLTPRRLSSATNSQGDQPTDPVIGALLLPRTPRFV
jgi:hypothetical protein